MITNHSTFFLFLLLSITILFFNNVTPQGSISWKPESAWELIANKTVWLKVSIGGVM